MRRCTSGRKPINRIPTTHPSINTHILQTVPKKTGEGGQPGLPGGPQQPLAGPPRRGEPQGPSVLSVCVVCVGDGVWSDGGGVDVYGDVGVNVRVFMALWPAGRPTDRPN